MIADVTAYAYKMNGGEWGEADDDKNISLDLDSRGDGIWGNETNIWVSDATTGDLLAYNNGWSTVTAGITNSHGSIDLWEVKTEIDIFGERQPAIDFGSLRNDGVRPLGPYGLFGKDDTLYG